MWSRIQSTAVNCTRCLFVQAHPQPEVVRIDVELALDLDDVGREEQQKPAAFAVVFVLEKKNGSKTLLDMNDIRAPSSAPLIFSPTIWPYRGCLVGGRELGFFI